MAKLTIGKGLSEYLAQLEKIYDTSQYIGKAVYDGAAVVNKAVESELQNLPTDDSYTANGDTRSGIRSIEKQGLINSYGIAKMQDDNGFLNVKLGFDGYNKLGKANAMVARSVISGTSFLKKNDFMGHATKSTQAAAEEAMRLRIDTEINNIVK